MRRVLLTTVVVEIAVVMTYSECMSVLLLIQHATRIGFFL